jgi:hypothetical protein
MDIVVDWKQSAPQIIAALIGSSLIVTALSMINSFIFKPVIDISVDPHPSDSNVQNMNYTISLKNIGYAPATHLRLTISYPGAEILPTSIEHKEENMTVGYEGTSVVAFLPRVTPGASISIDTSIFRNSSQGSNPIYSSLPLVDYSSDNTEYVYPHELPYSIVATYDQGSNVYRTPPQFQVYQQPNPFNVNTDLLQPLILVVLALLIFAIALRHKRRSKSKFASDILTDTIKVRHTLNDNSHKSDSSEMILPLHAWQSNIDRERQIISDYRDYQKIDDFYIAVRSRNCYLLQDHISTDTLIILNKECLIKARIVYAEIDWRKFLTLDLVFLIPAIVLGSLFITYVCEGIPTLLMSVSGPNGFYVFSTTSLILRTISSYFIIRVSLKATQGVIVNYYGVPSLFQSFVFLLFSLVVVGIPFILVIFPVLSGLGYTSPTSLINKISYIFFPVGTSPISATTAVILDIGRMLLLTWVVWSILKNWNILEKEIKRLYRAIRIANLSLAIFYLTIWFMLMYSSQILLSPIIIISIAIFHGFWCYLMVKHRTLKWSYIAIAASTIITFLWFIILIDLSYLGMTGNNTYLLFYSAILLIVGEVTNIGLAVTIIIKVLQSRQVRTREIVTAGR